MNLYRLLIVDDEKNIRRGLRETLEWESCGFTVANEAEDGLKALDIIKNLKIDAVLVDIRMPRMSGLEFIKCARKLHPELEFVIYSGYDEFTYAQQAISLDVAGYILKPSDNAEIYDIFNRVKQRLDKKKVDFRHIENDSFETRLMGVEMDFISEYMKDLISALKDGSFLQSQRLVSDLFTGIKKNPSFSIALLHQAAICIIYEISRVYDDFWVRIWPEYSISMLPHEFITVIRDEDEIFLWMDGIIQKISENKLTN